MTGLEHNSVVGEPVGRISSYPSFVEPVLSLLSSSEQKHHAGNAYDVMSFSLFLLYGISILKQKTKVSKARSSSGGMVLAPASPGPAVLAGSCGVDASAVSVPGEVVDEDVVDFHLSVIDISPGSGLQKYSNHVCASHGIVICILASCCGPRCLIFDLSCCFVSLIRIHEKYPDALEEH